MNNNDAIKTLLKKLDNESFQMSLINKIQMEYEKEMKFLDSELCQSMCSDILKLNTRVHSNELAYNPENLRSRMNWINQTESELEMFFHAMCNSNDIKEVEIDVECPFENKMFKRNGVRVHVIYGQGCIVSVSAPDYKE